ncbi:MAG: glutathione S-transferase family protein [Candidatus Lambdaproteobacteria bacterium]|nr:glutathione S-transferase family protein [Candidatus Lambdaproteobacteria bacterium]
MITIYGIKASRAFRCMWLLEELGVPYQRIDVAPKEASQRLDLLKVNPNGRVPALVDGAFVLFESMAINAYLAERYDTVGLWPASREDRARVLQWSCWGVAEVEEALLVCMRHRHTWAAERREPAKAAEAEQKLQRPLKVLEGHLAGRPYLLGEAFTVADLNLAAIFTWARFGRIDFGPYPSVARWIEGCLSRPARKKAVA